MRRTVIGSEIGAEFTPGFGALQQFKRPRFRLRLMTPLMRASLPVLAVIALSLFAYLH